MGTTQHHTHLPEPEPDDSVRVYAGSYSEDLVITQPALISGVISGDVEISSTVTITGVISGDIKAKGKASITNAGTISGDVRLAQGSLTNRGTISGDVNVRKGASLDDHGRITGAVRGPGHHTRSHTKAQKYNIRSRQANRASDFLGADFLGSMDSMMSDLNKSMQSMQSDLQNEWSSFESKVEYTPKDPGTKVTAVAHVDGHKFEVREQGILYHNGRAVEAHQSRKDRGNVVSDQSCIELGGYKIQIRGDRVLVDGKDIVYA